MKIGLIPLDERPVNTRYPAMIGSIAGWEIEIPPLDLLSHYRQPASTEALHAWIMEKSASWEKLVVSIEMLAHGGLIASRITDSSTAQVINRLEVLRQIKAQNPKLQIFGFNLVTRISFSNSNVEEPEYWRTYGEQFYLYSQLYDQMVQGHEVQQEFAALSAALPQAQLQDFVKRRMRNHAVNLAVMELLVDGVLDLLVISSDDTSAYGFGPREKRMLVEWMDRMRLRDQVLFYPGADEVGCVLTARAAAPAPATFYVDYMIPEDRDQIAPFEDVPVSETIQRQIMALGGKITENVSHADAIVMVNPPSHNKMRGYDPQFAESERDYRHKRLMDAVQRLRDRLAQGQKVLIADVAYPNGSDPVLIDLLRRQIDLTQLIGYGGWNTAGNTIGTVLAHGLANLYRRDQTAAERFLLHRLLEDWGYMIQVRPQIQAWLRETTGQSEPDAADLMTMRKEIELRLRQCLTELPGFAHWQIVPGSVRSPWNRTFEVDFDLAIED